jgi:hypothetical protein
MEDVTMEDEGYHFPRLHHPRTCALDGSALCAKLTQVGAANAALAHLKHLSRPAALRARGRHPEEQRVTRGAISRFVCWICEGPGVFRDMCQRGLLQILVNMLSSSDGDERTAAVFAVGVLAMRHDAARAPLRALGAIRALGAKLQVCQGM